MKHIKYIALIGLVAFLSSCGGGGDSSSDAGGNSVTYVGTQTLTVSAQGSSETAPPARFVMSISGDDITISDADFTAVGKLNGDQFSVTSPSFNFNSDGLICTNAKVTYAGSRSSNKEQVSGKISGVVGCNGVNIAIGGTFSANSNQAKQLNRTFGQALAEAAQ